MTPLLPLLFLALPASAFEMPLTRMQKVEKLVDEGYESILHGNYLEAAETCARAIELRSDYAPAYLCRGEARLKNGDPEAGKDALRALELDPRSGDAHRVLGMLEYEAGRYAEAIGRLDSALEKSKLKPDEVPTVYYFRARSKLKLGNLEGALKDAERGMAVLVGIQGNYFDWSFYSLRAEVRRKQGKTKEADADEREVLRLLEERIRRRPREAPELLRLKAESHSLLRDYDGAAKDYADLLAKDDDDTAARVDRADALVSAERFKEAEEELTRTLLEEPGHPRALRLRGYARLRQGQDALAVEDLDAAISTRAKDGTAFGYRAIAKLNLEDYTGALQDIEKAQALSPAEAGALDARKALALERLGRFEPALSLTKKVLARLPESYSANVARARSGVALGRCAEARASLDWLVDKVPQSGEFLGLRAECRCREKDFAGCLTDSEKAAALAPDSFRQALDLAQRHRGWLDAFPLKADEAELRRGKRFFEKAQSLGRLPAPDLLLYGRTLFELSRGPSVDSPERGRLLIEAETVCRSALKQKPKDRRLKDLCNRIRKAG